MLLLEERQKTIKIRDTTHIYQRLRERGNKLFGNVPPEEMMQECFEAIRTLKGAVVKDERGRDSTHHCLFISDNGMPVCLPFVLDDERMIIVTLLGIDECERPLWFIRKYNEIARTRNLPLMNYTI